MAARDVPGEAWLLYACCNHGDVVTAPPQMQRHRWLAGCGRCALEGGVLLAPAPIAAVGVLAGS
jgi:hypothetical protein